MQFIGMKPVTGATGGTPQRTHSVRARLCLRLMAQAPTG